MHPLETYLTQLREIHATGAGVPETSYYGALENLFNEVGRKLKPRVRCVLTLQNRGAGLPDGGLFAAEQFTKTSDEKPIQGQKPARGAIVFVDEESDADQRRLRRFKHEDACNRPFTRLQYPHGGTLVHDQAERGKYG